MHSVAADRGRGVDDDDGGAARVGVDVDETVEPHVEAAFFARFADGGGGQRLAAVDVAAGEDPLAVAGLDRAPHEHELTARSVSMIVPTAIFGSM